MRATPERDLSSLLRDRGEVVPVVVEALQLGEHDVLAAAVDSKGSIPALPDAVVDRSGLDAVFP